MTVSLKSIISIVLSFIFFAGFNGTNYFLKNIFQDLALLTILILFIFTAFFFGLKKTSLNWTILTLTPLSLCIFLMVSPALSWSNFTGANPLPSIAAARAFIMILIFPILIFLVNLNYPVALIEKIFIGTAAAVTLLYIFHYYRIDILSYYHSSDVWESSLILVDSWRGYRLAAPLLAFNVATVASWIMLFRAKGLVLKFIWLLTFSASIYCWILVMARQEIAMLILGILCYHFWFAYKPRLGVFFACIIIAVPIIAVGSYEMFKHLEQAGVNDKVRYYAYLQAYDVVTSRPFFGAGVGSYKSIHEGQIFRLFSSTDIGIFGILFRYGLVGAFLYYSLFVYVVYSALKAHYEYRKNFKICNIILIFILIRSVKEPFVIMLSTDYAFIQGIMQLSVGLAISKAYLMKSQTEHHNHQSKPA